MSSPETIDFERLLAPVSEDNPTGTDLKAAGAPEYYTLKDACRNARRKERSPPETDDSDGNTGIIEIPEAKKEWHAVFAKAQAVLTTQAKDLEVAAWLIESLVRLYGFAGLRDGFRLVRELLEKFGTQCFPRGDAGQGIDAFPLRGLNGEDREGVLLLPMRNVPITLGPTVGSFASWHYELASSGGTTRFSLQDIEHSAAETERAFLTTTFLDLQSAAAEFEQLSRVVDALCGSEAFPTSNIRNELASSRDALKYLGVSEDELLEDAQGDPPGNPAPPGNANAGDARAKGPDEADALTREEAFRTIAKLAAFFRRTEPHSPVSYALERIVRWGSTPLPALLEELVDEDTVRASIFRLTGIPQESGPGTDGS